MRPSKEQLLRTKRIYRLASRIIFFTFNFQNTMKEVADKRHEIENLSSMRETRMQQMDIRIAQISQCDGVSAGLHRDFRG